MSAMNLPDPKDDQDRKTRGEKARMRRRWILDRVRAYGKVAFDDIYRASKQLGFPCSDQSLIDDADEFESLNLPVVRNQRQFLSLSAQHFGTTFEERESLQTDQKQAIGKLALELLWGKSPGRGEKPKATIDWLWGQIELPPKRSRSGVEEMVSRVGRFLHGYWSKRHRMAILDAGTTTLAIARHIALADEAGDRAGMLTVLTNSPKIEHKLLEQPHSVGLISVGGKVRIDTAARTGHLCNRCLEGWDIKADVAIVGSTSFRFSDSDQPIGFACDSDDEAETKAKFLDISDLKCVAIDSSKILKQYSSSFIFAKVAAPYIDVIVTDTGILEKDCRPCHEWFWDRGIVVLTANPVESARQ
jgi:DeoR/GlpR family transcriptional regulator of sugar metabolism